MQPHDHDLGLAHDLERLMHQAGNRRGALRWLLGGAGGLTGLAGLTLAGCGGGGDAGRRAVRRSRPRRVRFCR